ncbi:hypothetical protein MTO96_034115 [Rhipicephalus appendiculatus]
MLVHHAATKPQKIQPKHRSTLSPAQTQKPGRRYKARLGARPIVLRHYRTLVRHAPSTATAAVVAAEVATEIEAEVRLEDHHDRRNQSSTSRSHPLPPARSLKLLHTTTANHRIPQAQRGDPQEVIKDPCNHPRGAGSSPSHKVRWEERNRESSTHQNYARTHPTIPGGSNHNMVEVWDWNCRGLRRKKTAFNNYVVQHCPAIRRWAMIIAFGLYFILPMCDGEKMSFLLGGTLFRYLTERREEKLRTAFYPNVAFSRIVKIIGIFDDFEKTAGWNIIGKHALNVDTVTIGEMMIILLATTFILAILIAYLSNVLPWTTSRPQHLLFPIMRYFAKNRSDPAVEVLLL